MNALLFAIQFLTRIPVPFRYRIDHQVQRQSFYWHGVVGLLIGIVLIAGYYLASWLFQDAPLVIAVLLLILWTAITGALHLDGLADSADAWLGGYGDKDKTLAIMKDPTSGPAAIVWVVLLLLLKFAALVSIAKQGQGQEQLLALLAAPVIARLASMALLMTTPYVRENGLGSPLVENIKTPLIVAQIIAAAAFIIIFAGANGAAAIGLAIVSGIYWRNLMLKRIHGTTGDTAGALIEWVEAVVLLGFTLAIIE
ncbi:MAG: adenosylcobinamide-GDP ribazoletransferase [Gammaproteobacteria bacterium]|nr:MAG: adenosylcobinamide-GDP ribazoletransferase [Gammaproteobacteria bacterium]